MPQSETPQSFPVVGTEFAAPPTVGERIDFVMGFLRRRYLIILICLLLAIPMGGLYHFTAPATYTASTTMMIESQQTPLQRSQVAPPDAPWIESQIGVIKSVNVAAYVVKQLRLADDPEFTSATGLFDKIFARLGWKNSEPASEAERVSQAISTLSSQLEARRVGQSYLMQIDFRSVNPGQAIKVANAMIDGYIFEQLNSKYQANRRAGDWLQERLQTLREQTAAAERAVIEFKSKNNIVAEGGSLMSDKRLSEMSARLGAARAHIAEVQVRLERIKAVHQAYQQDQPVSAADETVAEAMSNGIINGLRTRYLELVNREADFATRYGKNHTAVVNLRNQIREIRTSIRDELGRIEQTFKSEYEIAKKRQDEMENGLAALVSQSTETNQAQIALFSLEAAAQSYRKIYDTFLQQHTEAVQQQSFPISNARALSAAGVRKTGPQALKIWFVTIFAGGMLGVGLGALREIMDRGFRTRDQIRSVLNTECLALVPMLMNKSSNKYFSRKPLALAADQGVARRISSHSRILRTILDEPSSPYADAIRSIKLTVDLNSKAKYTKVIGMTSCLPNEGKSTVAAAMAALIAQGGARVILVDCDLRNPSLSRTLTPQAQVGFLDVIAGKVPLADAVWVDPTSNLTFLPMVPNSRLPNAIELLCSEAAKSVFSALQIKYDYVIVDLAPLVAALDARVASRLVDSYLLVIAWGSTKVDAVQYALRNAPGVQENIVGAVLNKVDIAAMSRYDTYSSQYYYGQNRPPIQ
jgi:succinoglycan biosynthesis transport protein ExoP